MNIERFRITPAQSEAYNTGDLRELGERFYNNAQRYVEILALSPAGSDETHIVINVSTVQKDPEDNRYFVCNTSEMKHGDHVIVEAFAVKTAAELREVLGELDARYVPDDLDMSI